MSGNGPRLGRISRGTDDDVAWVLEAHGVPGEIERTPGEDGWDRITVRVREADLDRVSESRIQTALEAATNCEIEIVVSD